MSVYTKEYFNDDHEQRDHHDCGLQYIVRDMQITPVLEFTGNEFSGQIIYDKNSLIYTVKGQFFGRGGQKMTYWAANPILRGYSYSGSGLPYANPEMAYENTPNQGDVVLDGQGGFEIKLDQPSSYYVNLGKKLIQPHVHLAIEGVQKVFTVQLGNSVPHRSLTGLPGRHNRTAPGPLGGTGGRAK